MGLFNGMRLEPFGKRLKSLRTSRGITDVVMASKLGIDIDTYRLYESDQEMMPNFTIIRASKILNYPQLAMNVRGTGGRGPRGGR